MYERSISGFEEFKLPRICVIKELKCLSARFLTKCPLEKKKKKG